MNNRGVSASGRKRHAIWAQFAETGDAKNRKATCKRCKKTMQGLVERMKKHKEKCAASEVQVIDTNMEIHHSSDDDNATDNGVKTSSEIVSLVSQDCHSACGSSSTLTVSSSFLTEKKCRLDPGTSDTGMLKYVVKTTQKEKHNLDKQLTRFVVATNATFRSVNHSEFKKLLDLLRLGYKPPDRSKISGSLLDEVYNEELQKCVEVLRDRVVCLSFDGWSNVNNHPIICCCVIDQMVGVCLIKTIDTSGNPHTSDYLEELVTSTIVEAEKIYGCKIRSVVTDNAANMAKCRRQMSGNSEDINVITYCCGAHQLNLLAKELNNETVTSHILPIIKYFRNNHFARAEFRGHQNASALKLPTEVRWNSTCDALDSYLKNWNILISICENGETRDSVDKDIKTRVTDLNLKRNCEALVARLKPVATTLDLLQSDSCTLADAVFLWKNMIKTLEGLITEKKLMEKVLERYHTAVTPYHFLAFLISPTHMNNLYKYRKPKKNDSQEETENKSKIQIELTPEEKNIGITCAEENFSLRFFQLLLKFISKTKPFVGPMMTKSAIEGLSDFEWWNCHFNINSENPVIKEEVLQLTTAIASSASVERIFSTFGLVHSELRNRLGVEKAAKMTFLMKQLNKGANLEG